MPRLQDPSDQAAGGFDRGQIPGNAPDLHEGQPDRPARGSMTDLRHRLERLPPGHPSSPYHDDGSRRPAAIRLQDLELPVPSHADATEPEGRDTGSPDAGRPEPAPHAAGTPEAKSTAAGDQPRCGRDGSWEWKGRHLTPDQSRIADETLSRCRTAEGRTVFGTYKDVGLTPAMRRIEAQLEHGQLVPDTEKFALKSPDRFKEKLASLIADEPGAEPTVLAAGIHDAIRYTYLFANEHYSDSLWGVHNALEDQGFVLEARRNSWENQEYKGVNSRWRDQASGQLFEVQFHTNQSWEAKQQTHEAYEGIAAVTTSASEKERLRTYQREVSSSVPIPPGALEISDYRKDE